MRLRNVMRAVMVVIDGPVTVRNRERMAALAGIRCPAHEDQADPQWSCRACAELRRQASPAPPVADTEAGRDA